MTRERPRPQTVVYLNGTSSRQAPAFEAAYANTPSELEPALHNYVLQILSKPERDPR